MLTPACYSLAVLKALSGAAVECGKTVGYHLKVDTGMTRLGVGAGDIEFFFCLSGDPSRSKCLRAFLPIYPSSEIHQSDYTDYQLGIFREGLVFLGRDGS